MLSPCGHCKMHVHASCFNQHQIHQFQNNQCVFMKDGNDTNRVVFYMTCSVCKTRYEHTSPELIRLLTQQVNSHENDAETRPTDDRGAMRITQFISSVLSTIPEDTRETAWRATRTVIRSLAQLSTDEITPQIKSALNVFKASLYIASFSISIVSCVCLHRFVVERLAS